MATRDVEIRVRDTGIDEIAAKLDKLKMKFDELSKKVISPKVNLDGVTEADVELDRLMLKMKKFGMTRETATLRINTNTGAIRRDLGKVVKDVSGGDSKGGLLSNIFSLIKGIGPAALSGGGSAAGGILGGIFGSAGNAGGGGGGGAGNLWGGLLGTLIGLGVLTSPALIPFGLGGLVGGGAGAGAFMLGSHAHQRLLLLSQQLGGITGNTRQGRQQRAAIQQQMAAIRRRNAPSLQLFGGVTQLGHTAESVFNEALTSKSRGFSGGPGGHPGTSFLTGLMAILKEIGPFLKQIGPLLGELFRASLPSVKAFLTIMIQFAKAVMPAVLMVLKQLQPYLPILVQGFLYLSNGIAGMIKNLGPGIKDGAIIFKTAMIVVGATLRAIGSAATGFAILIVKAVEAVKTFAKNVPHYFDEFRHETAVIFDGVRHDIAHIWDLIFADTIGKVQRIVNGVSNWDTNLRHSIANVYDGIRHDIAHYWDLIWNNTIGRIQHGVQDVESWFNKLPTGIKNILSGLGKILLGIGTSSMQQFLAGLRSVGGSIFSWAKNFITSLPGKFLSWLHMSPPHPGSAFYDVGASIMHHMEAGIQSRAHRVSAAIRGSVGGPSGGSAAAAAAYGRKLAAAYGWSGQWGDINAVAMRESGWSMTAQNPTSPAYGIAQFIKGAPEYYQWGGNPNTIAGQVTAFYNYIRGTYGDPARAWAHEMNYGWYDRGGVLKKGLTLALNTSGHDEYVHTGAYGGGGGNVIVNVNGVSVLDDQAALKIGKLIRGYNTRHGNSLRLR